MKKAYVFLFFFLISHLAQSQLILNLQFSTEGIQLKSQLWNFSIMNSGTSNMDVKVQMVFSDAANGQVIFTASSATISLSQPITQLQVNDLSPITYSIVNANYGIDTNPYGLLPVGHFNVCIAVMKVSMEALDMVAEECEVVQVEPASPPILISPADEEILDITRPFFTWLPPTPVSGFNNLTYNWVLKELNANQAPSDAIQQNVSLFYHENLSTNSISYPSSLPDLDTSKTYVWQVSANSSNNPVALSEIWTFKVRKYGLDTVSTSAPIYFSTLKREEGASYGTFNDIINYKYLNELNDLTARLNIYDISHPTRLKVSPAGLKVNLKFGENYINTNISDMPGIIDQHIYLLELIDSREQKWHLKFEFRSAQ